MQWCTQSIELSLRPSEDYFGSENSDKYSKNLELIIKVLTFISAWHREWTGIFSKARLLRLLERTHSSFSLVLFSTTRLSSCLLRSSHSWNRNSPTVTSQCRPCNCFLTQETSPILDLLSSGIELIRAVWKFSKKTQKSAFLFFFARWPDCVIIPQLNLACVVRGIISSLKTNPNRPNLKTAFVGNLIKRVMSEPC